MPRLFFSNSSSFRQKMFVFSTFNSRIKRSFSVSEFCAWIGASKNSDQMGLLGLWIPMWYSHCEKSIAKSLNQSGQEASLLLCRLIRACLSRQIIWLRLVSRRGTVQRKAAEKMRRISSRIDAKQCTVEVLEMHFSLNIKLYRRESANTLLVELLRWHCVRRCVAERRFATVSYVCDSVAFDFKLGCISLQIENQIQINKRAKMCTHKIHEMPFVIC